MTISQVGTQDGSVPAGVFSFAGDSIAILSSELNAQGATISTDMLNTTSNATTTGTLTIEYNLDSSAVPEPSLITLLGGGLDSNLLLVKEKSLMRYCLNL